MMKANTLRVYTYAKCDTCCKALRFLTARGIAHEAVAIREHPPTVVELRRMLGYVGDLKKLFNTSGREYKAMNLRERLPTLTEAEAIALLAQNGNLVKRPFALTKNAGVAGFREEEWERFAG